MVAEHGTAAHVEKLVRAYRRCQEAEELSREQRQQQSRKVSFRYDDDGSLVLNRHLPAEAGALVMKALDLAVEGLPIYQDVPAGTSRQVVPYSARRADALARVAESYLAHDVLEAPGTDRRQIVVHVAAETLRSSAAGCCEIEHGPSIPAETARRFSCDASVVSLVEDEDGKPLNVGRKTRIISAPLRHLLTARDKGCRFPGCCNARYIDMHHIKHWANGGETRPSNLVSLVCVRKSAPWRFSAALIQCPPGHRTGEGMKKPRKRSESRRSTEIRGLWQQRVSAQQASGIAQTRWCRENGVEPKYFSVWKGKLAKVAAANQICAPTGAQLVPVTLRPNTVKTFPPSGLGLTVTLPNGVSLSFNIPDSLNVAPLLRELAGLPC